MPYPHVCLTVLLIALVIGWACMRQDPPSYTGGVA